VHCESSQQSPGEQAACPLGPQQISAEFAVHAAFGLLHEFDTQVPLVVLHM
jgi:hypothetical protein